MQIGEPCSGAVSPPADGHIVAATHQSRRDSCASETYLVFHRRRGLRRCFHFGSHDAMIRVLAPGQMRDRVCMTKSLLLFCYLLTSLCYYLFMKSVISFSYVNISRIIDVPNLFSYTFTLISYRFVFIFMMYYFCVVLRLFTVPTRHSLISALPHNRCTKDLMCLPNQSCGGINPKIGHSRISKKLSFSGPM